jgi:hypothetical protein
MSSKNKRKRNMNNKVFSSDIESNERKTELEPQVTTTISSYNNIRENKKKKYDLTERKKCITFSNGFFKHQLSSESSNTFYKTKPKS